MSTKHLLADDLQVITEMMPESTFSAETLPAIREGWAEGITLGDPAQFEVQRKEIHAKTPDGPDVRCLLYIPDKANGAGYVHIHGGGYILGTPEDADRINLKLASELRLVILSVDYRLAPEHPNPAPLLDCYAGLTWLHDNAAELGVDRSRIAVGGESAGGGLAAALAIHARDQGNYEICHQHLTYPMLDNLTGDPDHPGDPLVGEFVWTRTNNQFGWKSYLGDSPAVAPQVPARVESFAGLPSTWLFTAGLDLFRDENIRYAQGLMAAGIAVELTVFPGACHGFQLIPNTVPGKVYFQAHQAALARALDVSFQP